MHENEVSGKAEQSPLESKGIIEKIISDKTKIDESNFYDLCDLIALNYVYTYLKDGTKIPIL